MNRRRDFLVALGSTLAWPRVARAQPTERTYRIGWLSTGSVSLLRREPYNVAFLQRLSELGFVEGRNLVIEYRAAEGRTERLAELAADLAQKKCDVFLAPGPEISLIAIKKASRGTPIVMVANDYDPLATGHIASLARPGGRITGVSQLQSELPPKRLELLKELLPKAKRIAVFSDTVTAGQLEAAQASAHRLGVVLKVVEFKRAPYDYEHAFAEAVRARVDALLALVSGLFVPGRQRITELALKHRLPSMFGNYLWAEAGGLLAYGPNFSDFYRRAAEQISKILKGAHPAELPVEQPTTFELAINLKTAKALGITIPQSMRLRADRLIE